MSNREGIAEKKIPSKTKIYIIKQIRLLKVKKILQLINNRR